MQRYIKRPIPVEAKLLTDETLDEVTRWLEENNVDFAVDLANSTLELSTLEGTMRATIGRSYIVKGVVGEIYPVEKSVFERTYLPVGDGQEEEAVLKPWRELLDPFYSEAPASTRHHLAERGGLLKHTENVMRMVRRFYLGFKSFTLSDALLAAYLHDIGKIGRLEHGINLDTGTEIVLEEPYYVWDQEKGRYRRNENVPDHVELGQYNLMQCLKANPELPLPWEVWLAVTYHNGPYHENFRWPIRGNEPPLVVFVHYCDLVASRFLEG